MILYGGNELPAVDQGVCYMTKIGMQKALDKHRPHGQAWRYARQWTTYMVNQHLMFKNINRLIRPGDDLELFWKIIAECEAADLKPPTSLSDMWNSCFHERLPLPSVIAPFRGASFGGWEQAFMRGEYRGKVYHYDLNRAYQWAASCGLPDLESSYLTQRWYNEANAVYVITDPKISRRFLPYGPPVGSRQPFIVTSEERDACSIPEPDSFIGIGFDRSINLALVFSEIGRKFPTSEKRISQLFWGMWNTQTAPEQHGFKSGNIRYMKNPFYNPIWSAFVTSRVKLRMLHWRKYAIQIFVDSIHSKIELPTSDDIGGFKLVDSSDYMWIEYPGMWGYGPFALKHSGRRDSIPRAYFTVKRGSPWRTVSKIGSRNSRRNKDRNCVSPSKTTTPIPSLL